MGDRVKFWTDWWCGDSSLQLSFLVVFGIASNREAYVASSLERLGIGEWRSWDVHFIQRPNDWEMGVVDEFLRTLGSNWTKFSYKISCSLRLQTYLISFYWM